MWTKSAQVSSDNATEQEQSNELKEISQQTNAKIEKWKKEVYKAHPSKRLSPDDFSKFWKKTQVKMAPEYFKEL